MDRKRIQCWLNASQHVHIYLQPFLRYSELLVENCDIFTPRLRLAAPPGWPRRNFTKILVYTKLEWMGYRVVKKAWRYVQPFWYNTSVWRTDGRTDGQTSNLYLLRAFRIADARKKIVRLAEIRVWTGARTVDVVNTMCVLCTCFHTDWLSAHAHWAVHTASLLRTRIDWSYSGGEQYVYHGYDGCK